MGHDIDIIDVKTGRIVDSTYITGNFSKYDDKYPGIYAIHAHKNDTVIKIIRRTLDLLLDDGIVPCVHNPGGRALTFGDKDPRKDLECYAACLQDFLYTAYRLKREKDFWSWDDQDLYWYSDQVFEITKYSKDGYESDGIEQNKVNGDGESDDDDDDGDATTKVGDLLTHLQLEEGDDTTAGDAAGGDAAGGD